MPEPIETPTEKTFHLSEPPKARRRTAPWLAGGLVLLLLFVLIVLQMSGLWEFLTPDSAFDTLLLYALSSLNFAAFIVFSFILVRNLLKLRRERRERQLGSKIKTRLIVYFITVSLLPITAMAVFSYLFLNRSLEKWFGWFPADVVSEARLARDEDAAQQAQSLLVAARLAALALERQPATEEMEPELERLATQGNLAGLAFISPLQTDAAQSGNYFEATQGRELEPLLEQIAREYERERTGDEKIIAAGQFIVALVPLSDGRAMLAARANKSSASLDKLISGAESFEQLRRRQRKVRMLGLTTLGLMTLLLLFAATWSAIHLARGIGTPIRALAEAADMVARGNLSHRVTAIADDELALLAASFNQMTEQLEENRRRIDVNAAELREKNMALAERRDYIETVLQSLSTGVISLDEQDRVTTINPAALMMLRLNGAPAAGTELSAIISSEDHVVLERVLKRARRTGRAAWQMELGRASAHEGGGLPVALTATALSSLSADGRGVVFVIEDLSELLAAQRAAAWSEVARRMAHEIKNPLTPIQLSAERIWRNFQRAKNGDGGEPQTTKGNGATRAVEHEERVARVVEECTQTITREVAGLKAMVDEFSRFARLPHARLEAADLNEVVRQAVALYEDRLADVRLDVLLAQTLPPSMLDAEQLRRVFVNLIDNALEAMANTESERRITIATGHDPSRALLLVEVTDTGHGIARQDFQKLFQPSFSTRGRGTGLGLAIVQRIITEHGGRIRAESNRPHGAKFTVELPVTDEPKSDQRSAISGQLEETKLIG